MNAIPLASSLALALFGGVSLLSPAAPVPVPGPGGVAIAVRDLLAAQDAGVGVEALLGDGPHALDMAFDGDGKLGDHAGGVAVFLDVDRDGRAIAAKTPAEFAKACVADAATGGAVRSVLGGLRATCASPECSWTVFTFERVHTVDGREVREPMRGSAMLRYDADAKNHFRVYQWHVSRGPAAAAGTR